MKNKSLFFYIVLYICSLSVNGQNSVLDHYNFGEGLNFVNENGSSLKIRGYFQPYFDAKMYSDTLGDSFWNRRSTNPDYRSRIRRLRIRITGKSANERISYKFQTDLTGNNEVDGVSNGLLLDAWVAYNITKRIKLSFGQRGTPTDNRELSMGSNALQLIERSKVTSAFSSIREFGFFLDGTIKLAPQRYLKPSLVITNGDGINGLTQDRGGLKYGGRLDVLPFGLFTNFGQFRQADIVRENSPKLIFGGYYSYNDGMSSRRGRTSGDIIFLNNDQEESLPDYEKYGFDFLFKFKGFSMLGEYVKSRSYLPSDIEYYVRNDGSLSTGITINDSNYPNNKLMLGQGYNIQLGYVFRNRTSLDLRYCHLNADDNSFLNNNTFYNRPNYYTFGLTKYLSRRYGFKIQGSVTFIELGEGANANVHSGNELELYNRPLVSGHEIIYRFMTTFSF